MTTNEATPEVTAMFADDPSLDSPTVRLSLSVDGTDYLIDAEDLDLASADREKFEIKKIMESICNDSISSIDFSRLDVNWLYNLFLEN